MLKQIFQKKYFIAFISTLLICCMFLSYIAFLCKDDSINLLSLPTLSIENFSEYSELESYLAYDICEIYSGNPWKEEWNITTLPVFYNIDFKNRKETKNYDEKIEIIKNKMEDIENLAKNFGIKNYVITYGSKEGKLESKEISFQTSVYGDTIFITFKKPIILPFSIQEKNKEQSEKIISYFIDNYKDYFNWKEAETALHFNYDTYGEKIYSLYAYEKGETLEQKLLNYHFNNVWVITNNKNEIIFLLFKKTELSDKIGDYPIITVEQAKQLLYSGTYPSTLENTFSQNMTIVKTELVYRDTIYDSIFMPCYKFFVQLPETKKNGLHHYDIYYIPAIEEQYYHSNDS